LLGATGSEGDNQIWNLVFPVVEVEVLYKDHFAHFIGQSFDGGEEHLLAAGKGWNLG
jgi:hypothetical protein